MSETLYRKYRPQSFTDLVGQRPIRLTLEQALTNNRVAHAYLFAGPRGVGKTTTARLLARAVNCLDRKNNPEPCNKCRNCLALLNGRAMDVMEIDAASQTGVDNIRENIIQSARALPSQLSKRVFIIDEVHMLSMAAFNALLKLLEEPPAHAMFILATTEIHRVPETIISRTQRFDFQRVPLEEITSRLVSLATREHRRLATGVAERIGRQSSGSLRDAESMLGQLFAFSDKEISHDLADLILPRSDHQLVLNLLEAVLQSRAAAALGIFHSYIEEGGDVPTLVREFLSVARSVLLARVDPSLLGELSRTEDSTTLERITELSAVSEPARHVAILDAFSEAQRRLPTTEIEELPVELAIINTCSTPEDMPPAPPAAPTTSRPEKPAPAAPKKPTVKSDKLSLAEVSAAWGSLQADASLPPGLALSLKQACLADYVDGTIILEAPYRLHMERLSQPQNLKIMQERLGAMLSLDRISIETRVNSSMDTAPAPVPAPVLPPAVKKTTAVPEGDDLWGQVVSTFGAA